MRAWVSRVDDIGRSEESVDKAGEESGQVSRDITWETPCCEVRRI